MIPDRLLPHTATVLTPWSVTDEYGNDGAPDWGLAHERTIRCRVDTIVTAVRAEDSDARQVTIGDYLLLTNDLEVRGSDRLVCDGLTYEIVAQPVRVAGAGLNHHLEVRMRAVEVG